MRRTSALVRSVLVWGTIAAGLSIVDHRPAAAQGGPAHPPLVVNDVWLRKPAGDRNVAAVFAIVENHGMAPQAIVGVASSAAEKGELHEMQRTGEMMRMSPVARIDVPAHGRVELKPGGLHVMLFGLKKTPMAGDKVPLTLTLEDGTTVAVEAAVRQDEGMKMNDAMPRK